MRAAGTRWERPPGSGSWRTMIGAPLRAKPSGRLSNAENDIRPRNCRSRWFLRRAESSLFPTLLPVVRLFPARCLDLLALMGTEPQSFPFHRRWSAYQHGRLGTKDPCQRHLELDDL